MFLKLKYVVCRQHERRKNPFPQLLNNCSTDLCDKDLQTTITLFKHKMFLHKTDCTFVNSLACFVLPSIWQRKWRLWRCFLETSIYVNIYYCFLLLFTYFVNIYACSVCCCIFVYNFDYAVICGSKSTLNCKLRHSGIKWT